MKNRCGQQQGSYEFGQGRVRQFKVRLSNHIWRTDARLLRGEHTIFDEAHNSHLADAQPGCCFVQNNFSTLRAFTFVVNGNAMVVAECSHALLRPGIIFSGPYHKSPIQQ